jgi:hypothetical protein
VGFFVSGPFLVHYLPSPAANAWFGRQRRSLSGVQQTLASIDVTATHYVVVDFH